MPTAILIGFECKNSSSPLIGALIDLYHAYNWCKSFHCTIYIITDIVKMDYTDNLRQAIIRKIADDRLLTFYEEIKSQIKMVIQDKQLIDCLQQILCPSWNETRSTDNRDKIIPDDKLIIYYSGHGVKDSMVMPDNSNIPFIKLRDMITGAVGPFTEIFWILDCCNPNGLHLPYKLHGNGFTLSSSKIACVSQPILLITSAEENEKSVATEYGSFFSRHLFHVLTKLNLSIKQPKWENNTISIPLSKNRNLSRLLSNLTSNIRMMHSGYTQTVSIYSSYVMDPVLWMWVGSNKSYDIVSDITLSIIAIRPHKKKKKIVQFVNPYDIIYPE